MIGVYSVASAAVIAPFAYALSIMGKSCTQLIPIYDQPEVMGFYSCSAAYKPLPIKLTFT